MQDLDKMWGACVVRHVTKAGVSEKNQNVDVRETRKRMPSMRIELISEDIRSCAEVKL
jgi:hypothetical protein